LGGGLAEGIGDLRDQAASGILINRGVVVGVLDRGLAGHAIIEGGSEHQGSGVDLIDRGHLLHHPPRAVIRILQDAAVGLGGLGNQMV
jgi:hypothetical protein